RQQIVGAPGELALVGVRQAFDQRRCGEPGHFGDFGVLVVEVAVDVAQQVVVHRLVDARAVGDEPVVDDAQLGDDLAVDARLLPHFAFGGGVVGFAGFDVALRHRPQQSAAAVEPADQRDVDARQVNVAVVADGFGQAGDDEPAGRRCDGRPHPVALFAAALRRASCCRTASGASLGLVRLTTPLSAPTRPRPRAGAGSRPLRTLAGTRLGLGVLRRVLLRGAPVLDRDAGAAGATGGAGAVRGVAGVPRVLGVLGVLVLLGVV